MFRRDISENHEKSSTAQLLSFIFLVALIAVVVRLGAPGLQPEQPHDVASVAAVPAYRATLTLEYLGDDASSIESVALDFAPHTDYRLEVRRSRADASDFDALITGAQPIMTVYYPENVELAGRIPPMDGHYTAQVRAGGAGTDTLDLQKINY